MVSSWIHRIRFSFYLLIALYSTSLVEHQVDAQCVPSRGCTALAFYNITLNDQLNVIYNSFSTNLDSLRQYNTIQNEDAIFQGQILHIPFECSCTNGRLAHNFTFNNVTDSDNTERINRVYYSSLSKPNQMVSLVSSQIFPGQPVFVPVNCSCGDPNFPDVGLFLTYPVKQNDTKDSISSNLNVNVQQLGQYNPSVNLDSLSTEDRLFIPAAFANGTVPRFRGDDKGSSSSKTGVIGGAIAGVLGALLVAGAAWFWFYRRKKRSRVEFSHSGLETGIPSADTKQGFLYSSNGAESGRVPAALSDFAVDRSVEFTYEELASATDNFNISNKIGEGGYGAVYYGEIRNQKLAIKKMNMQATREFMSELKVLTHVHHTNLVQLIGFCTVDSLFLVYEYIDNGTLAQHLRGSESRLSWNQRIQIALDTARGLEYIHEHTKPTYIHRDVKSPNILIDKNFRAKVADFGLTKLTESSAAAGGSVSLTQPTRLVGTFGYMPPEYARFGDVSPKIDVYSFGVVLFEIISAKDAIVRGLDLDASSTDTPGIIPAKGLVTLFDGVLKVPDASEKVKTLVDPALGTNYPFESVWKLAKLAEACTQETPDNRPNMRAVVVALMTLCSTTTELLDFSGYSDPHIHGLVTGR